MAANKRTETQREEDLLEIARLDRRGWTQREIAAKLGVSHVQVGYDLKTIRERYATATQAERAAKVEEMRQQYRDLIREAYAALERSKEDKERRVAETVSEGAGRGGSGTRTKAVKQVEGRLPANEYMRTIMDCLRALRELDGLDEPKKIAPTTPDGEQPYDPDAISDEQRVVRIVAIINAARARGTLPSPGPPGTPGVDASRRTPDGRLLQ